MNTQTRNLTTLPKQIPAGSRIVVRTYKIIEDNNDGTQKSSIMMRLGTYSSGTG